MSYTDFFGLQRPVIVRRRHGHDSREDVILTTRAHAVQMVDDVLASTYETITVEPVSMVSQALSDSFIEIARGRG